MLLDHITPAQLNFSTQRYAKLFAFDAKTISLFQPKFSFYSSILSIIQLMEA